ncbi:hypothetical protein DMUE_6339, partial [Dictyocoela muelleri]
IPVLKDTRISTPKIKIELYLLAIYKWVENVHEKDVLRNLCISKKSFQKIKKNIYDFITEEKNKNTCTLLVGKGKKVQVDETVICHGDIADYPSKIDDDTPGITWLVGIIEEDTKNIKLEIVPNRSANIMKQVLARNIAIGTKVVTDGHRSYPAAVEYINGEHIIVNHSMGFKNMEGFHTNNIENLWSLLKYEIRKRRGIKKVNLMCFLNEFWY